MTNILGCIMKENECNGRRSTWMTTKYAKWWMDQYRAKPNNIVVIPLSSMPTTRKWRMFVLSAMCPLHTRTHSQTCSVFTISRFALISSCLVCWMKWLPTNNVIIMWIIYCYWIFKNANLTNLILVNSLINLYNSMKVTKGNNTTTFILSSNPPSSHKSAQSKLGQSGSHTGKPLGYLWWILSRQMPSPYYPTLIRHEIIFEAFQPMWPRYLKVTDRRTDVRMLCHINTVLCIASHVNYYSNKHFCQKILKWAFMKLYFNYCQKLVLVLNKQFKTESIV